MRQSFILKLILLIALILALLTTRMQYANEEETLLTSEFHYHSPSAFNKLLWGHVQGLGADFMLLDVFLLYDTASSTKQKSHVLWQALLETIQLAQALDPKFYDVYHIAIPILAYDAELPKESISLAYLGAKALPLNWQIPFTAGFIAYDTAHDYHNAAKLMTIAANAPNPPSLAIHLAARFLKKDIDDASAISFLKHMLQITPKKYHKGIKKRLSEIINKNK